MTKMFQSRPENSALDVPPYTLVDVMPLPPPYEALPSVSDGSAAPYGDDISPPQYDEVVNLSPDSSNSS